MRKVAFFGLALWLAATLCGHQALAEYVYSHQQISGEMFEPKIWANENLNVLWSAGPDYQTLTLYDNGSTVQLTDRLLENSTPVMNAYGLVAWVESDRQVYLFNGDETLKLSGGNGVTWNVDINRRGQVVWDESGDDGGDIYFFDGKETRPLATSGANTLPKINEKGEITWVNANDFEIFYFDGNKISQLTFNEIIDIDPQISSSSHVVWIGNEDQSRDVYYYDRHNVIKLTNSEFYVKGVTITSKGHPFWIDSDGLDCEIFTFTKGTVWQVTNNDYEDSFYQANDKGQLVWMGWAGSFWPWEIFCFDGHDIHRLTNNDTYDMWPVLNNHGLIAWTHHAGPYISSGELHLFDGTSTQALTTNNPTDISDRPWFITDKGDIVYTRGRLAGSPSALDFYMTIFLARKQ